MHSRAVVHHRQIAVERHRGWGRTRATVSLGRTPSCCLLGVEGRELGQSARGPDRPSYEIAPLLESIRGSKQSDPEAERSSSVVTLLTLGDPRIDPPRIPLSIVASPRE